MRATTPRLPVDAALPQLATALDAEAMGTHFAAVLAPHGRAVRGCSVERIKYRPGRNLSVSYRLDLGGLEQRVAARFCTGGQAAARLARAQVRGDARPSPAGPALSHSAVLDMVAHWWPNDPKLAAAGTLADDAGLAARWLPGVVAALAPGRALRSHRVALAQVVPEHRVTARVDLTLDDGTRHVVYAKGDAERRGPATHAVLRALADSAAAREGRLHTPPSLGWQPEAGLHWQGALDGTALLDRAPQVAPDDARGVGALLAALHASDVPAWPVTAPDPETGLTRPPADVAAVLAAVEPAWAPALARLVTALEHGRRVVPQAAPVTLHGDLHPRNLLRAADGRLGLIDLDSVRPGPAALDLGAWLADALHRDLMDGGDGPAASSGAALAAFLDGYRAGGGRLPAERQLAWATACQLLCQRAWRSVVNLKPGRVAGVPALLARAERLLAVGRLDAALDIGAPA